MIRIAYLCDYENRTDCNKSGCYYKEGNTERCCQHTLIREKSKRWKFREPTNKELVSCFEAIQYGEDTIWTENAKR